MKNYDEQELNKLDADITAALIEAADFRVNKEQRDINIVRKGKTLFTFKVEALSEEQWQKCRRDNTRRRGREEIFNDVRSAAQAIYMATVDKTIWDNRAAWEKLNVASGVDLVNVVLTPAEKDLILSELIKLSNVNESDLDELIKN